MARLSCGECGDGYYVPNPLRTADYACVMCGREINSRDFDLDEGESLALISGHLFVMSDETEDEEN